MVLFTHGRSGPGVTLMQDDIDTFVSNTERAIQDVHAEIFKTVDSVANSKTWEEKDDFRRSLLAMVFKTLMAGESPLPCYDLNLLPDWARDSGSYPGM